MERRWAREGIIFLHTAGAFVCRLAVELQKIDAEFSTFPTDEFLKIEIQINDKQTIPTPGTRLFAAGH